MRGENVLPHQIGFQRAGGKGLVEALDVGVGVGVGAKDIGVAEDAGGDGVDEG